MQERLRDLTAAGHLIRPEQQRQHANALYRKRIYQLGQRGARVLIDCGIPCDPPRAHGNFARELMTSQLMASFALGAQETGVRLITWQDIQNSVAYSKATARYAEKPRALPLDQKTSIVADGEPFGISPDGRFFFAPGIEADCGTEIVSPSDLARSSIQRKFEAYLYILEKQIFMSHFGFPAKGFCIPFITTSTARMTNMMHLLERMTHGSGSRSFIFKVFPHFASYEKPPEPSGHMLTQDWQRVGYPPFNFLTS
jgi:Replication-relaxation